MRSKGQFRDKIMVSPVVKLAQTPLVQTPHLQLIHILADAGCYLEVSSHIVSSVTP